LLKKKKNKPNTKKVTHQPKTHQKLAISNRHTRPPHPTKKLLTHKRIKGFALQFFFQLRVFRHHSPVFGLPASGFRLLPTPPAPQKVRRRFC
ncbi:MAG: hypothetical protein ACQETJ_12525, partial [Bacteroidota bacterium]